MPRVEVHLPDLAIPGEPIRVTVWHVARGTRVERGDPILELTAGAVTVDVPAPVSGLLVDRLAAEDELVKTGDPVAVIDTDG